MKKWHKISLLILIVVVVLILLSLTSSAGRHFWNQVVVTPVLKPFSEPCGYGGTTGMRVECECSGTLLKEIQMGATPYYCLGKCTNCQCSQYNFTDGTTYQVECAAFSKLSWAFPLE